MFSFDRRTIYIIIAILVIWRLISFSTSDLVSLILTIPAVLIAITFHEFAHAFVADKLGDDTPRMQGRLNLNPLSHIDPIGGFLLLFAGFGWGKPVEVNPRNYTRKISMEKGEALVSIAGPVMNFILAIIFTIIYCCLLKFGNIAFLNSRVGTIIMQLIIATVSINIGLGLFNLIPLPPLDGSKVIMPVLPYRIKNWFITNQNIFYIVFLVIWITGIAGAIISPVINAVYRAITLTAYKIFGIL